MARLLTRAEYSRHACVTDSTISKRCKGVLAAACVGDRIDVDHPASVAYLKTLGKRPPKQPRVPEPGAVRSEPPPALQPDRPRSAAQARRQLPQDDEEDLETLAELLQPIVERFGTSTRCKDYLNSLKTLEEVRGKRLDNEATEGSLISRELVSSHIFSALENLNKRLLSDVVTTISQRLYGMAHGGAPLEEAKLVVRDIISAQLKPVKTTAARVLRNA